ncbi:MAG: hypothetical protein JWO30_1080 [Fibrobacteres bacterium]|nr:hypothetical protein [Fibrobacterota bacterium]
MKAAFPPGILPEGQQERIDHHYRSRPFSLFWEMRAILYLGVLFLCSGLGILIYKNIDTIGHQTILGAIVAATAACFWYCARHAKPFTYAQAAADSSWAEYMLLLGVLLFGVFTGYLQVKYSVFGDDHALALGLPATLYLFLAYRFDHRGVLQLAISGFCAAIGIVTTPLAAIQENVFDHHAPVWTGLAMGAALAVAGALSELRDFKRHFSFSYINFAMHLSMIAGITGLVIGKGWEKWFFFLLVGALGAGLWKYARWKRSHYFLLFAVLYVYVAFSYGFLRLLFLADASAGVSFAFFYFILSCAGTIYFFLNMKTFLKAESEDAGLPEK